MPSASVLMQNLDDARLAARPLGVIQGYTIVFFIH
jgi:hypothetical protein